VKEKKKEEEKKKEITMMMMSNEKFMVFTPRLTLFGQPKGGGIYGRAM